MLKVRLTQVRQRLARVVALKAWTPRWSTEKLPDTCHPQRREVCRKIKSVGQVEPSWRRHPNPHGSGPSKCGVRHSQPHPFHVAEFVPAAKHPMLVGLAQGRREGGPAIELHSRWASWCRWETSRTASLPDSNGQHTNPTTQTGPLDAIHPKEPTHEASEDTPTQGPAAGPANLGRPAAAHIPRPSATVHAMDQVQSNLAPIVVTFDRRRRGIQEPSGKGNFKSRARWTPWTKWAHTTLLFHHPTSSAPGFACSRNWARCRSTLGNAR